MNLTVVGGSLLHLPFKDSKDEIHGVVNLDIEMETGTGKTYVYIKTIILRLSHPL